MLDPVQLSLLEGASETAGPSAAVKPAGTCMPNGERDRARGGLSKKEEKEVLKSFLCSVCRSGRLERNGFGSAVMTA